LSTSNLPALVAWGGFILAFIFGFVANRTNFCTMGAVSDVVNMGSWGRMRMWLMAIAIAILGTHALQLAGLIDLSKSFYTRSNVTWASYVLGGFLFGVGMTLGSGCGSKTLVRIGGGSLKSLITFMFLGLAAYMTLKGLFAIGRTRYLDPLATDLAAHGIPRQDLPTLITAATGANLQAVELVVAVLVAAGLLAFVLRDREFRTSFDHLLGGIVVGLVIVGGWYVTGHLGFAENPDTLENTYFGTNSRTIESLSFTAPVGYALELLMLWSDKSLTVTFGGRGDGGTHPRVARIRAPLALVPLGRLRRRRGHGESHRGRSPDGFRRRDRARLHGGAGTHGILDARARLDPRLLRDRRWFRAHDEVPVLADDARGLDDARVGEPLAIRVEVAVEERRDRADEEAAARRHGDRVLRRLRRGRGQANSRSAASSCSKYAPKSTRWAVSTAWKSSVNWHINVPITERRTRSSSDMENPRTTGSSPRSSAP
jgi:uncharacterized membrane protein YedE/YeeE